MKKEIEVRIVCKNGFVMANKIAVDYLSENNELSKKGLANKLEIYFEFDKEIANNDRLNINDLDDLIAGFNFEDINYTFFDGLDNWEIEDIKRVTGDTKDIITIKMPNLILEDNLNYASIADNLHTYSNYADITDFVYEDNREVISNKYKLETKEDFHNYNKSIVDANLEKDITLWIAVKIAKMPYITQLEYKDKKSL